MPLNSHFVSRFLTQPWEHGDRRLFYYDFQTDRLKSASSRRLFARVGSHSTHVESRLNQLIETPIAAAREHLWSDTRDVSQSLEWPLFRALALLFLLQPFRSVQSAPTAQTLEETISKSDVELDELARAIGIRWQLMRVTVSNRSPLAYPSSGYFPLLGSPMGGRCPVGFAIPISPIHAFVGIEADVAPEQIEIWRANQAGLVSNYSVGNLSSVVVVHPSVVNALAEAEIISGIRDARAGVLEGIGLCRQMADLLRQIDTAMGLVG
jgi:hypothetical protein